MRRYKIILSNTKEFITIREDELNKVLRGIQERSPVVTREGIFNPSYLVAILPNYEREKTVAEGFREASPFGELIAGQMPKLDSPKKQITETEIWIKK